MQGAHWSYTPTVKCENTGIKHSWHNTSVIVYQLPLILTALLHVDLINVIITSLNSELTSELINRILGWCLLISSLPGKASRMHVIPRLKPLNNRSSNDEWPSFGYGVKKFLEQTSEISHGIINHKRTPTPRHPLHKIATEIEKYN